MNDSCGCRSILVRRYQDLHHRLLRNAGTSAELRYVPRRQLEAVLRPDWFSENVARFVDRPKTRPTFAGASRWNRSAAAGLREDNPFAGALKGIKTGDTSIEPERFLFLGLVAPIRAWKRAGLPDVVEFYW
jgi:hypothetical protein